MMPIKIDINQLRRDLATLTTKQLAQKYHINAGNVGQLKGLKDDKELALRLTKAMKPWV